MTWTNKVREWRIVSICSLIFISYILYNFMEWIQTSDPESVGTGVAITGALASLAAIYKFVFDFAVANRGSERRG